MRMIELHQNIQFARQELPHIVFRRVRGVDNFASQDVVLIRLMIRLILG